MLVFKCLMPFLILFFVQGAYCKPMENITEGRGIGSTLWEWITYPFSWWGSSDTSEAPPAPDHLIASTIGPYDNVEISSRNVTIWCNDHTCTTMKCDKAACVNTTCNIYDTDVTGQCREYNTNLKLEEPKPEEPKPSIPTKPVPSPGTDDLPAVPETSSTTPIDPHPSAQIEEPAAEHPLELEAALSSTVTKGNTEAMPSENKPGSASPQNKI